MTAPMTGAEARALRASLGLTTEGLAAELGATEGIIEHWEAGDGRVPTFEAETLRYRAALKAQDDALAASGLAECVWFRNATAQPPAADNEEALRRLEAFKVHLAGCESCQAREKYVQAHCPPLPPVPQRGWQRVVFPIAERVEALPHWGRPPVYWALAFLGYTLFRGVFMVPRIMKHPSAGLTLLLAIPLTLAAGASLGFLIVGWRWIRAKVNGRSFGAPSA